MSPDISTVQKPPATPKAADKGQPRRKVRRAPPKRSFWARFLALSIITSVLGSLGFGAFTLNLIANLPSIEEIRKVPLNIPLRIYNGENELIAEYGNERRIPVDLDETPAWLIDAVLTTEDENFYHHGGVDFSGLARAVWHNIASNQRAQGASTITMQVARNFFLTPERTYRRKYTEILLAYSIENALTKDEILELYFNKIFLGHRAYGFASAARVYYGLELGELSLPQIAMLAGLPKAPSRSNPLSAPKRAKVRRDYVLKRMYQSGRINRDEYENAVLTPITATSQSQRNKNQAPYAAEMARKLLVDAFGQRVYGMGLQVTLTINSKYQEQAARALRKGLINYDRRHGYRGAVANINAPKEVNRSRIGGALGGTRSTTMNPAEFLGVESLTPELLDEELLQYPISFEMLPAVVLDNNEQKIVAHTRNHGTVTIPWHYIKWARPYINPNHRGPEPTRSAEVVNTGDIIYVTQTKNGEWRLTQLPEISGALVSLDVNTGAILSLIGGFDYYLSKFNRASSATRQPGSNIKPFIYSAALENGFTASSKVSAGPIVVDDAFEGIWRPENYSKKFFGPTRLREALSRSLNLVSVRLVRAVGIEKTIAHLEKFGFNEAKMPRSLSISLGSIGVSPIQMAAGFAVFANGGLYHKPYIIDRVVDQDGNEVDLDLTKCEYCRAPEPEDTDNDAQILLQPSEFTQDTLLPAWDEGLVPGQNLFEPQTEKNRVISRQNAFLMSDLLNEVVKSGTGKFALTLKRPDLSGKTGTTNDFLDAWFTGFNRDIVTSVYVGFDDPSHLGQRESGATAALPIWVDYMRTPLEDSPTRTLIPPENISARFINKTTAQPTFAGDPNGYFEYYVAGTEPDDQNVAGNVGNATEPEIDANIEGLF